MATVAHSISRLLPAPLTGRLRPLWHRTRDIGLFAFRQGGRIGFDRELNCWVASRKFGGRWLRVAVRSYKELRRFHQFGQDGERDVLWKWMHSIADCEVVYDVGSANGLEGMLMNHLHGCTLVFVEPFTPSIETILKSTVLARRDAGFAGRFEIVHAAIDEAEGYRPLLMHEGPVPGATGNTFADPAAYCRGGREDWSVLASQWVKSVTLDGLHTVHGLPLPTHVKMDVDGFEDRAMRGAAKLLRDGQVRSWAIEVNDQENLAEIGALMRDSGYVDVGSREHYPGSGVYTADHIYARKDLAADWRDRLGGER